jgi:uncharacterized repeat protein (TIGR01451 family)
MNRKHTYFEHKLSRNFFCRIAPIVTLGASFLAFAPAAHAAGTLAGTDIENIATASYDNGGVTVDIPSNKVIIKVDELLDVTVVSSDPGDKVTSPGQAGNVLTYQITNIGNGSEAFAITADVAKAGDDFNPTLQQIILDSNGNGVYDPGTDDLYVPGTNDPVLLPDANIKVFVITATPATVIDANRAEVGLFAQAKTGTGAPGTAFAGLGEGGGDAVVGASGADAEASGFLVVQAASIGLVKTAIISDPYGGSQPVPGATITYKIVATVTGSGSLSNVVISDPIPANTQYLLASINYETVAQTDAADITDQSNFNGTVVTTIAGTIPAGQTRTLSFKVKIQ